MDFSCERYTIFIVDSMHYMTDKIPGTVIAIVPVEWPQCLALVHLYAGTVVLVPVTYWHSAKYPLMTEKVDSLPNY